MSKIEEMAIKDLPVVITGNGWDDWDENEVLRKGYILGANAILKEIETRIAMGRHASMQTAEMILDSVEMTIKELKGE